MSIDLTKTLESLQRKINSFDSTGDEYDLKYLLKAALRGERSTVYTYATEDDLPNLLDDSAGGFDNEMLVYAKDSKQFYFQDFQNKLWKPLPATGFYQGSNAGFLTGGSDPLPGVEYNMETFPFATDIHSSIPGSLPSTTAIQGSSSSNSTSRGYIHSNLDPSNPPPSTSRTSLIHSFPFAISTASLSEVGNLLYVSSSAKGITDARGQQGFHVGGSDPLYPTPGVVFPTLTISNINKFPFSSGNLSVTDHGNMTAPTSLHMGVGSPTKAIIYMGRDFPNDPPRAPTQVEEFPFSSNVTATNIGPSSSYLLYRASVANEEYGYLAGGYRGGNFDPLNTPGLQSSLIEKFPFSSGATLITVGNLTAISGTMTSSSGGISSTEYGYVLPRSQTEPMEKFSFVSDTNAVTAGTPAFLTRLTSHSSNHY